MSIKLYLEIFCLPEWPDGGPVRGGEAEGGVGQGEGRGHWQLVRWEYVECWCQFTFCMDRRFQLYCDSYGHLIKLEVTSDYFTAQILYDLVCHLGEGHRGTQELILSLKKSLEAEQLRSMTLAQVWYHGSTVEQLCSNIKNNSELEFKITLSSKPGARTEESVLFGTSTSTWFFHIKVSFKRLVNCWCFYWKL